MNPANTSEEAATFRFIRMALQNAVDAEVLPCIKKPRKSTEVRRIVEAIRQENPERTPFAGFNPKTPLMYDYWITIADLQDFSVGPDRLDSGSSDSPWSHSRAALAKALWLFIRNRSDPPTS